jgi:hypothetical protein
LENKTAFEEAVLRGADQAIALLHQSGADIHPGSGSQSIFHDAILRSNESYLLLPCENGVKVGEDSVPIFKRIPFIFYLDRCDTPGGLAVGKLLLDYGAKLCSKSSLENPSSRSKIGGDLPARVELVSEYGSNIHEIPLSHKEPATTLLSVINYDDEHSIQLLLEKRTNPKSRHL